MPSTHTIAVAVKKTSHMYRFISFPPARLIDGVFLTFRYFYYPRKKNAIWAKILSFRVF